MDLLAEAGFSEIELMITRDPRTQEPDIPLRIARERGLKIAAVHGPFLVITKTVWGADPIQKIARGAEFCREVGATSLIVHPPYLWERDYARWLNEEASTFSSESGVNVAVETMYPKWVAGRRMRAYRWLEAKALYEACHLVAMDTSHVTVARQDILDVYEILAPKLVHIHLSNNAGDGRDGHLELEKGILPLDRLLDELRRNGYAGAISLELSVSRYLDKPAELVEMLGRARSYVEQRLSGSTRVSKGLPRRLIRRREDR